jgi:hypothetical protein
MFMANYNGVRAQLASRHFPPSASGLLTMTRSPAVVFAHTFMALSILALAAPASALAAGVPALRTLTSKHLTLVTDLPPDEEVDALPGYFDQAFEQWCAYFDIDPAAHENWQVHGHLMQSRERFQAAGLLPENLPEFATGYSLQDAIWLYDQTSVYYRRQLLLHEGTHAFMNAVVGGTGPSWYAEGLAELLGTHRLDDGKLTLNVVPRDREEVPKWGRIEAVQADFARKRALTLAKVFKLSGTLHGTIENYGWCWAAAAFLENHPRYHERFRGLQAHLREPDFAERVDAAFAEDRARLDEDWQLFVTHVDYGYDFARMDVELIAGKPLDGSARALVAADRGWQSSGVAVEAGKKYRLRAAGRYQVAGGERPWTSEPGGVTIHYERGQPLGILLAAVRSDDPAANSPSGLIRPIVVGLDTTLTAQRSGTLYLRVNDSAGGLADNTGSAEVEISAAP